MSASGWGLWGSEENVKALKNMGDNEDYKQRHRRLVKSTPCKSTRITLRSAKAAASARPAWNSGSPSPTTSKTTTAKRSTCTLPRKLPIRGKLSTKEELNYTRQKEGSSNDIAATIGGTDIAKELRSVLATSQLLQDGINEESFNDSDLFTSPRLKLPLISPAQIRCDPAVIACGPRITDRGTVLRPESNHLTEVYTAHLERTKIGDHLECFWKTLGRLKKVDRKAIRELLECLKHLDSDEEQRTKPKQTSRVASNVPSTFSNNGSGSNVPNKFSNNGNGSNVSSTFSNNGTLNPRAPAFRVFTPKQEPIWVNTLQIPTIIDQADDDFQEFCRANNFIPLVPVPVGSMNSLTTPYLAFKPDPAVTYTIPFDDMEPLLPVVQSSRVQSLEPASANDIISLLEETSEPREEDVCREAKALDPVWGGQILENFVKKYPMTGQVKSEESTSEQRDGPKAATTVQQKQKPKQNSKSERKASRCKPHNRATEIQQELEMIMLQQRERNATLESAQKAKATEIQQKLEIMLFMLKEQKALEGFSKRVCK